MDDGQNLYDLGHDAIDEDIVGMHDRLARAREAARAVNIGMMGQALGSMSEQLAQACGRSGIAIGNIVDDGSGVLPGLGTPDEFQT